MARLIHLNGAPGAGKSTVAERYVAEHPGVLNCDIDRLPCLVGGWADDFDRVGQVVQPVALAMIRAHLDGGHDVVLPQMLASPERRATFRAAATDAGHDYVHLLLQAQPGEAAARFYGRPDDDRLHAVIRGVVDAAGGDDVIEGFDRRLTETAADAVVVDASQDPETVYQAVLAATR